MATATPPGPAQSRPPRLSAPMAPGVSGRAVGREMLRIQRSPLDAFDHYPQTYGDVCRLSVGDGHTFFLRGAEAVRQVMISNQDNYKKSHQYALLQRILGLGLVTNEGESWQRQRSLVQPMFAKRHLSPFAVEMGAAATTALDAWERDRPNGTRVDMTEEMSRLTLDVVGRTLVGTDFSGQASAFGAALATALQMFGAASRSPLVQGAGYLPKLTPERGFQAQPMKYRAFNQAMDVLDDVVDGLLDRRLADPDPRTDDLLGLLISARDPETGEGMTRTQIRDELMTFVTAGHETTANGLTWMWYLLSQNPAARDQLLAEVDDVLGGATPTADDAERLPWTSACFQEAMRLFPPVWHVQRQAINDDVIGGYLVPRRSLVILNTWATHRDPRVWPNPAGFAPRRFIGDAPKQRPRHAYLPFAGGRRVCVGQGFAMMEATILAAMVSQRFTFDLIPGANVVPEPTVTLRPQFGMPMTLHRRPGS